MILRRTRDMNTRVKTGWVIFNEAAEDGLHFYSRMVTRKNSRTTFWSEKADRAKIFEKESTAKGVLSKLKKCDKHGWYSKAYVSNLDNFLVQAWEIDCRTFETRLCKAWQKEIDDGHVFKTELEAIDSEIKHNREILQSHILSAMEYRKDIQTLEQKRVTIVKEKTDLPNIVQKIIK